MSERFQILFMQIRLVRLAAEEWNKSMQEVNRIFKERNVYHYIMNLWGLFHVEGDYAVLKDIEEYLKSQEAKRD